MTAQALKPLMSAERAEEEVKAAADAINKQLPKEAQGGSMQPLVEEKEEGQAQPLDTFSSEIDSFDMVTTCSHDTLLPSDSPCVFRFFRFLSSASHLSPVCACRITAIAGHAKQHLLLKW